MRTRKYDWLDMRTGKPKFGLQVHVEGRGWLNAMENGKPCIYTTEAKRDAKRVEFRKLTKDQQP